jgi:hypothetical protein
MLILHSIAKENSSPSPQKAPPTKTNKNNPSPSKITPLITPPHKNPQRISKSSIPVPHKVIKYKKSPIQIK